MSENILEISLPSGVKPKDMDLDLLKRIIQLISHIENDGWEVHLSQIWMAEAQRGQNFECATGKTSEEALQQLYHHTKLARQEGCP